MLNRPAVISVPGALTIGDEIHSATGRLDAAAQIAPSAAVTVNALGVLDLNGNAQTIGSLTMGGGQVATGAGTLTLNGDLLYNGASEGAAISGRLDLGGAPRTFEIANGAATADLAVNATILDGAIQKTGSGRLELWGANKFAGGLTVSAGDVLARDARALGTGPATVGGTAAAAALYAGLGTTVTNEVTIAGGGGARTLGGLDALGTAVFGGGITLQNPVNLTAPGGGTVEFSGAIGGDSGQGVTKTGLGSVILSGTNTFAGDLTVSGGRLVLRNADALGTGSSPVNVGSLLGAASCALVVDGALVLDRDLTVRGIGPITLAVTNAGAGAALNGNVTLQNNVIVDTAAGSRLQMGGTISDDTFRSLTKTGAGTLELSGSNTYRSFTLVQTGTLLVQNPAGSATGDGTVQIAAGATLGGTGTVRNATVQPGGLVTPGASVGTLHALGDVQLLGTLRIELDPAGAGACDLLQVGGDLNISAATVDFLTLGIDPPDDPVYVFASSGHRTGEAFASVQNLPSGYQIDYAHGGGNEIALVLIPEPGTAGLLLAGALALWRRKQGARPDAAGRGLGRLGQPSLPPE